MKALLVLTPTLRHSDTPTLRHSDTPTLRHSDHQGHESTQSLKPPSRNAKLRLRLVLQAFLLFFTMQANASNYFTENPGCKYLAALVEDAEAVASCAPDFCDYTMTPNDPDCGFLITSATCLPNGDYEICVQANDQASVQSWSVWNGFAPPVIATSILPNICWTITPNNNGSIFTIIHTIELEARKYTCTELISILCDTLCVEGNVTASVNDCDLETTIHINTSNINTPYVITFGDGSPADELSGNSTTHTYGQAGSYEVCLTYGVGEIGAITCCDTIKVTYPDGCFCENDVISVQSVEPCTWLASLNFDLDIAYFPISVDFGDGTSGVVSTPTISHDFPNSGTFNICYRYEIMPGDTIECCELVNIPGCCLDPYFELNPLNSSPSCLNPMYRISDAECQGSIVAATHLWEFSDGTVFIGPNPPDHMFTNFLDFGGVVMVTHTVTCCGESASYTAQASHTPGAYLGTPNQSLLLDDILPFTNNTVLHFINQNANGPLPLTIDGTIIVNVNASFGAGTWNMGKDAEVFVQGLNTSFPIVTFRSFSLAGTVLQSAVRLNSNPGCCRWKGIRSELRTNISLSGASLMDADYALRYPSALGVILSNTPRLSSTGSFFMNNYFGIKSERQHVNFTAFTGNTMDGAPHAPQYCDCNSVNAIDFSNVAQNLQVNIQGASENEVLHYEKAFNFNNARLRVRGFEIHTLRNYEDPENGGIPAQFLNAPGDAAIGIDYRWSTSGNSSLNIDRVGFTDFEVQNARSVAVRDNITGGKHTLTASTTTQALFIGNVAAGYELIVGSQAKINGTIRGNTINTNGGTQFGFGVNGSINSADNILNVVNNTMSISTNSSSTLNGGVVLASPTEMDQDYKILDNSINVLLNNNGVGIGITNARGFSVRRNKLLNAASVPGIKLSQGGDGQVDCNDVRSKRIGIDVNSSDGVQYADNFFSLNIDNDIKFGTGVNNSDIKWNFFRGSGGPSLLYNAAAVTGQQHHNDYNQWDWRNGIEVNHPGGTPIQINCQFFRPNGSIHGPNTIMHPLATQPFLFLENSSGLSIDSFPIPSNFCSAINDEVSEFTTTNSDPASTWSSIVQNSSSWNGLTAAEQSFMRQEIYGLLVDNSNWTDVNSNLSGFKATHDASFIGQSESLRRAWRQLLSSIAAHHATQEPTRNALASLSDQTQAWMEAMEADPSLEASLQPQLEAAQQQGEMLSVQLQQADDQFFLTVQATVGQLLMQNAALDESSAHTWCEKRYNQIALNYLAGTAPDNAATADLRTIAQTCLSEGGRAVLDARGLCETWLKEYYDEADCKNSIEGRSSDGAAATVAEPKQMLRILPNPADDEVRISLNIPSDGSAVKLQFLTLSGQEVHTAIMASENGELTVPVKGWPDGVYVARVILGNETFSQTFVVQHH